jgi:hypothetical protein
MSNGPTLLPLIVSLARQTLAAKDLMSLITGKKPPPKLELFTNKSCDNPNQDVKVFAGTS